MNALQPRTPIINQSIWNIPRFRLVLVVAWILIASGVFHGGLFACFGGSWEGPLSLRKPALFGVSAGLTCWSLAWVLCHLHPSRWDRVFGPFMAISLLIEVGLITVQYWRGVPSHFNHSTQINTVIEVTMLLLITGVTLGIAWLCVRAWHLPPMERSLAIAIRGGLWLLLISCVLGGLVTAAGKMNIAEGRAPEIWGASGVLKFPHGIAIHALQELPILSWILCRFRVRRPERSLMAAVGADAVLLGYAVRQTLEGRSRFDSDFVGVMMLLAAGILMLVPVGAFVRAIVSRPRKESTSGS